MREVYQNLRKAFYALVPARCILCGAPGQACLDLCLACEGALPWNLRCCGRCGLPLETAAPLCGPCLRDPPPFESTLAPWVYAHPIDHLLMRYKFGAQLAMGDVLARLLAVRLAAQLHAQAQKGRVSCLVPVPLSRLRLRQRGFNQAWEMARLLAHQCGIPARAGALRRVRHTLAQSGLGAGARQRNVRRAFVAEPRWIRGLDVILVDDVMTTGATARACALALREAGAASVRVCVVARAPRTGQSA